jgi:pyruvate ferredoxin oxidoreductase delta subunit
MKEKGWKACLWGGVIVDAGNSVLYKTGDWRSQRPIRDEKKCTDCLQCWIMCPDGAIKVKDGKVVGIDYDYCKGCGICCKVCPFDAIEMEQEGEE